MRNSAEHAPLNSEISQEHCWLLDPSSAHVMEQAVYKLGLSHVRKDAMLKSKLQTSCCISLQKGCCCWESSAILTY